MSLTPVSRNLERISEGGNLLRNLELLDDATTWKTAEEAFAASKQGVSIEDICTNNLGIYRLVDNKPVFNLLGRESNPFMEERFRRSLYQGILNTDFFSPSGEMKEYLLVVLRSGASTYINYSELRCKSDSIRKLSLYVETNAKNTPEEKKLFHAVYGSKIGAGKRVYLLAPEIVITHLSPDQKEDLVVRVCCFDDEENFLANSRSISGYRSSIVGVRRVADNNSF